MSWETVSERASFFDPETLTVTYVVYETQISSSFGISDFLKKLKK